MTINLAPIIAAHLLVTAQLPPLIESLKDTTLPLDERWEAFTSLIDNNILVNPNDGYGDGYLGDAFGHSNVSLYDDFNMERGNSMLFTEVWESMLDMDDGPAYEDPAKRDEWRERVLASGFTGFTYDW